MTLCVASQPQSIYKRKRQLPTIQQPEATKRVGGVVVTCAAATVAPAVSLRFDSWPTYYLETFCLASFCLGCVGRFGSEARLEGDLTDLTAGTVVWVRLFATRGVID